jgi:hypothetical protein
VNCCPDGFIRPKLQKQIQFVNVFGQLLGTSDQVSSEQVSKLFVTGGLEEICPDIEKVELGLGFQVNDMMAQDPSEDLTCKNHV